jgi:anti-anti-sigma factor
VALTVSSSTSGDVATITLAGELDGATAPQFRDEVEKAAANPLRRLVLMVQELEYIASAGVRVLVYAKQKMGAIVEVYIVGAQEQILDTLRKTGVDRSVYLVDTYDEASVDG